MVVGLSLVNLRPLVTAPAKVFIVVVIVFVLVSSWPWTWLPFNLTIVLPLVVLVRNVFHLCVICDVCFLEPTLIIPLLVTPRVNCFSLISLSYPASIRFIWVVPARFSAYPPSWNILSFVWTAFVVVQHFSYDWLLFRVMRSRSLFSVSPENIFSRCPIWTNLFSIFSVVPHDLLSPVLKGV